MILADRYEIIQPLAQGGFGKTFLACDRYLPRHPHCVLKQFSPQKLAPDALADAHRLFDQEADVLYQLGGHPQIPTLLAHFEQQGEFYLVQEYVPGHSLAEELSNSTSLRHKTRIEYTRELLEAGLSVLAFVHQRQVIHRDIKPANWIRRKSDQQLVLIDFGAVKTLSADQDLTVAIGSPGYIAPEQEAGRPCLASDLYAMGVLGLYALTGLPPARQPRSPQTGQLQLPNSCGDSALLNFIAQLLRPYPSDRFPHAQAALDRLHSSAAHRLTKPHSQPMPSPNGQPVFNAFPETVLPSPETAIPPDGGVSAAVVPPSSELLSERTQPPTAPYLSASEQRNRQALLNKVHRFWIQGVLEHSLHGQVMLTLGLEERQQALALPWNITVGDASRESKPLSPGTRVYDLFESLGEGRSLLILGEPGAGKTTTLLDLARDLLERNRPDARIPAIFNLSAWTGGPIAPWLVGELNSKYQIPKSIGQQWVAQQQLLLLLDGLDEVRQDRRDSCAAAINQFHQTYGPELVVCCRVSDYESLDNKLQLQQAVVVRSLTDAQIWQYLDQADQRLTGLRSLLERSQLQAASPSEPEVTTAHQSLLELARSPLILNIMALTYQGLTPSEIPALTEQISGQDYTDQLFSAYVQRMFSRRDLNSSYSQAQTMRWLQELAMMLTRTSQTVFLIERMQVNWLTSRQQKWLFGLLVILAYGAIATAIGRQVVSARVLPLALVIGGFLCAQIFGLYRIVPAETLRWS